MNRLIISVIITLFVSQTAPGQDKFLEFDLPETGYKNHVARDSMKFSAGFSYNSTGYGSFIAEIDDKLICAAEYLTGEDIIDPETRQLNTTLPVGSIAGNAGVTSVGQATYSVPIFTPPGSAGMQPSVAIVYSSGGGNGALGLGFSIAGLSAITRTGKNIFSDNQVAGVNFNLNDKFALDGNKLVLNSGTGSYGAAGSTYGTETETFSKVTANGSAGNGPLWFKVETKDGKTIEYGNTADSRIYNSSTVFIWKINKISDANGNYITFTYQSIGSTKESLINSIKYTGNANANLLPYNSIDFYYETRNDDRDNYFAGIEIPSTKLLYAIKVRSEGDVIKEYRLKYLLDIFSRISQIEEFNGIEEKLNATVFSWGSVNKVVSAETISFTGGHQPYQENYWASADINNDGLDDLLGRYLEDDYFYYMRKYVASVTDNGTISFNSVGSPVYLGNTIFEGEYGWATGRESFGNTDEDSERELVIPIFSNPGDDIPAGITLYTDYTSNGYFTFSASTEMPAYVLCDLNNDGYDEFIYFEKGRVGGNCPGGIIYFHGSIPERCDISIPMQSRVEELLASDMNLDGLNDLILVSDDGFRVMTNNGGTNGPGESCPVTFTEHFYTSMNSQADLIKTGDFNGDGLTDFVVNRSDGAWIYLVNDKTAGFRTYVLSSISANNSESGVDDEIDACFVTDFNNDGLSDLIITDGVLRQDGNDWEFDHVDVKWYKTYFLVGDPNVTVYNSKSSTVLNASYFKKTGVTGDFNGDGYTEFVNFGFECLDGSSSGTLWRCYHSFNDDFDGSLITKVSNGYNEKIEFNYRPLTYDQIPAPYNYTFYDRGTEIDHPLTKLTLPIYCVWNMRVQDCQSSSSVTETLYSYGGVTAHLQGLGFLGFKTMNSWNLKANIRVETENIFSASEYFRVLSQTTRQKSYAGDPINTVVRNFNTTIVTGRYFTSLENTVETNHITGLTTTTTNTYTSDGKYNLTQVLQDFGSGYTITTDFAEYVKAGAWTENKPRLITVTKNHLDDAINFVNKTYNTYHLTKGYTTQSKQNYQVSGKEVTTNYSDFNDFGMPRSAATSGTGVTTMTTTYTYEPKGRFHETETNAVGTRTYNYDPVYGGLLSMTDIDDVVTGNTYDAWGRVIQNNLRDGRTVNTSYGWALNSGVGNACSYVYTSAAGSPWVKTWYDKLGRELRSETVGFNDVSIYSTTSYDDAGRVDEVSEFAGGLQTGLVTKSYFTTNNLPMSETWLSGKVVNYSYNGMSVTSQTDGKTYTKTFDNWGNIRTATDPGGTISYTYYSHGKPASVTAPGSVLSMTYDGVGNQLTLNDPDADLTEYTYDGFSRLKTQTDNKGNYEEIFYDNAGRKDYSTLSTEGTTDYEYYTSGNGKSQLKKITSPNGAYESFEYDNRSRLTKSTRHIDAAIAEIVFEYAYNAKSELTNITYPGAYIVTNSYDNHGILTTVSSGGTTLWTLNTSTVNELKYTLGNGISTSKYFTNLGDLTRIFSRTTNSTIQNEYYDFNPINGMLRSREDRRTGYNLKEDFQYNSLYMLSNWTVSKNGVQQFSKGQTYTPNGAGNIQEKTDIGIYSYVSNNHQINSLNTPTASPVSSLTQNITYNGFNKVSAISENSMSYSLTYGPYRERIKSVFTQGSAVTTMYYDGLYEKKTVYMGATREYFYIQGGDGIVAVMVKENGGTGVYYYVHKDHLGSIVALTNSSASIAEQYRYDPWGRRRNPIDWSFNSVPAPTLLNRGFTGHEHLDAFTLINMNGRVYDPLLGIFLSPDNYVQALDATHNYNRYAYCLNNPLIYTDPTGEVFGIDDAIMIGIILYSAYTGGRAVNNGEANPTKWDWNSGSTYVGVIGGGLVGWASYGIGAEMMAGGGFMANTMSFVAASHVNSVGMMAVTGGKTDYTLNFGFGSYNFTQGEYDGLFDGEKEWSDILYGVGFLGNLSDVANIVDSRINLEQRRIDEMQNYPPNGELDPASQGRNLDGLTYPGPPENGPMIKGINPPKNYYGPIADPNFVDALGFGHDLSVGLELGRPGYKNLITSKLGLRADWRFCYENYYLGTKNLFSNPSLSLSAYKNATFFLINKTVVYYGYQYLNNVGAIK